MYYRQLRTGVADTRSELIPEDHDFGEYVHLGDIHKDYYLSVYKFNEEQRKLFLAENSVAGIDDVVTDKLVFDFDCKENVELAKVDTETLCKKLMELGIPKTHFQISFSGFKGFHVEVNIDEHLTPIEHRNIAHSIAGHLDTFDGAVYDHSRPFRAPGSINLKSGLFKTPLTVEEFKSLTLEQIREKARHSHIGTKLEAIPLPDAIKKLKIPALEVVKKVVIKSTDLDDINFSKKQKGWTNCKWALLNGYEIKPGDRNHKLTCVVATSKHLNCTKEQAYFNAKNASDMGVKRYGGEKCSKDDIWKSVNSVYAHKWEGGTYSCKDGNTPWLTDICASLGRHKCSINNDGDCFIEISDFANKFKEFAVNIESNTLKFGVKSIDDNVMITTSMLVGLLGAPSSGKTSLSLNFLNQSTKDKIRSVFFSMDMGLPLVYLRLIQKHHGIQKEEVFRLFREDPQAVIKIIQSIEDEYKYTKFSFRTGLTVEAIKEAVLEHQEKVQDKVKLIVVDYLECISGPFSDATANTGLIANQLKDLANDLDVCVMLLLQPQKHAGDPSEPLLSMRNVKGSSVIEQACSVILTISRPGFSAITPENDKFVTISTVKDRMGTLMSQDCGWVGLTGSFTTEHDANLLRDVRANKKLEKDEKENGAW